MHVMYFILSALNLFVSEGSDMFCLVTMHNYYLFICFCSRKLLHENMHSNFYSTSSVYVYMWIIEYQNTKQTKDRLTVLAILEMSSEYCLTQQGLPFYSIEYVWMVNLVGAFHFNSVSACQESGSLQNTPWYSSGIFICC